MQPKQLQAAACSTLVLGLLMLAGCNKPPEAPQPNSVATAPAAPAPYTPPTAEQLSQMVAPIALFPDKLVGQVLAGATYPDQVTAANQWLAQNPGLKGDALETARSGQPWDVSVKSLTTFPSVLNQMASNVQWTTALGEAYVNDPSDVMNAIQALRLRAQQAGNLKSSSRLRVSSAPPSAPPVRYADESSEPIVYSGPAVIQPPSQVIVIEPAEPDVVYVPDYNPAVVYGQPVPVYSGWVQRQPAYSGDNVVTAGVLSFGVGVLVGAAMNHHHDGSWNAWNVNWGAPRPHQDGGRDANWHRPAVVYNNTPYISKSVTVVNHINNINVTNNNYQTTNNVNNRTQNIVNNNNAPQRPGEMAGAAHAPPPGLPPTHAAQAANLPPRANAAMTMPHFGAHDAVPGARPPHDMQPVPAAAALAGQGPGAVLHGAFAGHGVPHGAPDPRLAQQGQGAPAASNQPGHQGNGIAHVPAQAANGGHPDDPHGHADDRYGHADAAHEHLAQAGGQAGVPGTAPPHGVPGQHAVAAVPHPATQHPPAAPAGAPHPPAQHQVAAAQHAPTAGHDAGNPDHPQAHAAHADMLAMHNDHAHAAQPAAKPPAAKHDDNKHGDTKHHGDKEDATEHHS